MNTNCKGEDTNLKEEITEEGDGSFFTGDLQQAPDRDALRLGGFSTTGRGWMNLWVPSKHMIL